MVVLIHLRNDGLQSSLSYMPCLNIAKSGALPPFWTSRKHVRITGHTEARN